MYSRLVRGVGGPDIDVNDNTAMEGDIASGWEQPDPLTYIFKMKPNVKWQDKAPMNGRAATATDFVNTYDGVSRASPRTAPAGRPSSTRSPRRTRRPSASS